MRRDYDYYEEPVSSDRYWDSDRKNDRLSDLEKALREAAQAANRSIAIQFECGDCCKVVENGRDIDVLGDFVVLKASKNQQLTLRVLSNGRMVEKRKLEAIVIPVERVCSFEFGVDCY